MGNTDKDIWFPAKSYGWGWGFPNKWQGWVVFAMYFGLLVFGINGMRGGWLPIPYPLYFLVITFALILVCYLKGETPRWRWGP